MRNSEYAPLKSVLVQILKTTAALLLLQSIGLFPQSTLAKTSASNLIKVHIRVAFFAPLSSQVKKIESYRGDLKLPAKKTTLGEIFLKPEIETRNGELLMVEDMQYLHISAPGRIPKDDE